jgi:general secretion pathway protein G
MKGTNSMLLTLNKKEKHLQQGFTLIELVVVILILGILAATVGPAAFRYLTSGRENSAKTSLNALSSAIDAFHGELGSYPKKLEDLVEKPSGPLGQKWTSPYLQKGKLPQDPWGQDFQYKLTPGAAHPYELYSYGASGEDAPPEEWIDVWKI